MSLLFNAPITEADGYFYNNKRSLTEIIFSLPDVDTRDATSR